MKEARLNRAMRRAGGRSPRRRAGIGVLLALLVAGGALSAVAIADDISNNIDASIDAVAEVMSLNVGGANGTTQLYVTPRNGDSDNGCNFEGTTEALVLSVTSSDTTKATVSPTSVTFGNCGDTRTLTVTPVAAGSATISVAETSNNTGGSFNLAPATFTVDVAGPANTAPSVVVAGVAGGASYDKGSVPAATCNVTDAEDGNSSFAATLSAITGPYASDGIGSQTASCSYTDGGGLITSASETYSIVDPSPPTIGYTLAPASPDGSNGWYTSDVSLSWTVADSDSPSSLVTTGCVDQSITSDQAATSYSCAAESAGGTAGPVTVTIKRDATDPTVTHVIAPASPDGDNGWYKTAPTVSFDATDATSGIATIIPLSSTLSDGADQSVTATASDNAGNTASDTVSGLDVDTTKPTMGVTGVSNGGSYTLGSVPAAGCSLTDGLSGPVAGSATASVTGGNANGTGTFTATCTGGTDVAGNLADPVSVTYTVTYLFTGFFQPIDMGALNSVKAGSAVPVKFSLSGNRGLAIFAAGSPQSKAILCNNSLVDDIESTVTAGNSSLSYDAVADQYVYVWKTEKAWAGTCRRLIVQLNDGSAPRTADFKFAK